MNCIEATVKTWEWNRERTLATLSAIAELPDPLVTLGWRPGVGRAHIAWQLMHIGITEELFATERFTNAAPDFVEQVPRFRGGSTPDDDIPSVDQIQKVLDGSRQHLLATVSEFSEQDLDTVPDGLLQQRGWTIGKALRVITWHEGHHQGQAHITLNLFNANH